MDLVRVEALNFGGGDRRAEDAEHRSCVKAPRHHGRDEVGGHSFHHLVRSGDTDEECLAGAAGNFRGDEGRRQNCRTRVGQHAERIPLTASQNHFGIDEGGSALGEPAAVAQYGCNAAAAGFLVLHEGESLLARRHLVRDQR